MPKTVQGSRPSAPLSARQAVTTGMLIWRRFKRNRLAIVSGIVLAAIYLLCLCAGFFAPYAQNDSSPYVYLPPQKLHFIDTAGRFHLRPFVYGLRKEVDWATLTTRYTEDESQRYNLQFLVRRPLSQAGADQFRLTTRLFGVAKGGVVFLFGTDYRGRDLLTQILYGGRVTMNVGLFGVFLSTLIGVILGTASGYFGGLTDVVIQRLVEILGSIPKIPLWMAMAAIIPVKAPPILTYWGIILILGLLGWTGLARQIRAKVLSVRERDYVIAARAGGAGSNWIMFRHIVPNVLSHIIVVTTLALPGLILAESSISFLGLGIKPPMASWGLLLQNAQNLFAVRMAPWIMLPGAFIVLTVLGFNFLGDGLRDAADPYN